MNLSRALLWSATFLIALPAGRLAAQPAGEAQFLSHTRQLIFEGRRSGEGYFSADGKSLIFQSERDPNNPFYQIYILDFESGDSHRVSPGTGKTTCAFFRPNSDEVIFATSHHDTEALVKQKAELDFRASGKQRRYSWDYEENMDIFAARRDGTQLRRLTTAQGYDAEGSFSPDGKKIAFCSLRDAYPPEKLSPEDRKRLETDPAYFGEIYIMDADGKNQKRLTFTPGYDGGPFFSPDGQRIIWRRFNEQGTTADVYTMKLDGTDVRRLTDFGAMSWAPYFHPSGKYVIFTSNKLGFSNFELYMVDAQGEREPVRVTFTDGFDGLPVFAPDGKQLAWTSGRTSEGNSQIFIANWNHEAALAALQAVPKRGTATSVTATPAGQIVVPSVASALVPEITVRDLRNEVAYLASDALEGRLTGTQGAQLAADYIADNFRRAGLTPIGSDYFHPFEFSAGVRVVTNQNNLSVQNAGGQSAPFQLESDYRPLSFSANGEVEGEVIFAGYGLSVPGKTGEGYDSYAGLDVTNKIVLVLRYVPEEVDAKRRQELNRYAGLRYKALIARNRGAKALLVVAGPNSPNAGELVSLSFDTTLSGSGIAAVSINGKVADALLSASGKNLKAIQSELDKENPHAEGGFVLPQVKVKLSTSLEHIKKTDRNVIAMLPPAGGTNHAEYVLVGAHYDHLGHGETSGFARKDEEGKIHYGADDNASGTATVMELAGALASERSAHPDAFRRGIIFALWSGEELGLIGSSQFAEHPAVNLSNVVAYVNFDMVGRLRDNKLTLQGIGSSSAWRKLIEKRNVAAGFNLTLQDDPYQPTDVTALYPKHVPVLNFFTGSHEEYHRPADKPDTLYYEGMERITHFAHNLILDLAKNPERPDYVQVTRNDGGGSRENLRAYLGTIPDYATEVTGVKISGTRGGSPADKAGLKGGDIIVEFNGQKIANIYDYTYALDAVKIGQPVKIVVQRDGAKVEVTAVPEARK